MLKTRQLGKQGFVVSELGLGCMGMSQSLREAFGVRKRPCALQTLHVNPKIELEGLYTALS